MSIKKVILALGLLTVSLGYPQNEALFSEATEFYNKGEYTKALENYGKILENGQHSAALYFNLGNCHYKLGAIGPSIYYYEKALLLSPGDPEILNNLAYAENMRLDAVQQMPQSELAALYKKVVSLFTSDQWAYLAVGLVLLFVMAYMGYYFLRTANHKRMALVGGLFALGLGILCLVMARLQLQQTKNDNPAIIFSKQVKVSSEPNTNSDVIFTLHEGTKVKVIEELGAWEKIRIADGQTGWLLAENIKKIKEF